MATSTGNDDIYAAQLDRIIKATGAATEAELAKILGITGPSITGAKRRKLIPLSWFQRTAEMFGSSLDWLILGRDQKHQPKPMVQTSSDAIVYPPRYASTISEDKKIVDTKTHRIGISKTYLDQYASEQAFFVRMPDDSMAPGLRRNDLLLIDPCQDYVVGTAYAIAWGSHMIVRRYDLKPGMMVFTAIGEGYSSIEVPINDKSKHPSLIGRVAWMAREYW